MYENDKVDIKSSVVVELANALGTTAGYLVNKEGVEEEVDERMQEMMVIFTCLSDDNVRHIAIEQLKVLANLTTN